MRVTLSIFAIFVAGGLVVAGLFLYRDAFKSGVVVSSMATTSLTADPEAASKEVVAATLPGVATKAEDFKALSENQQLDLIGLMRPNTQLPASQVAFLESILVGKNYSLLVRNQAANALIAQTIIIPGLDGRLEKIVGDTTEDQDFRDYAVQFLASVAERSPNRARIVSFLLELEERGDPNLGGTAALHMRRLEDLGLVEDVAAADRAVITLARRPDATAIAYMGVLGAIAGRKDAAAHAVMTERLADSNSHVRRMAVAALAQSGNAEDQAALARLKDDPDPLVAMAATAAMTVNEKTFPGLIPQ